jgi:hypothetical protein
MEGRRVARPQRNSKDVATPAQRASGALEPALPGRWISARARYRQSRLAPLGSGRMSAAARQPQRHGRERSTTPPRNLRDAASSPDRALCSSATTHLQDAIPASGRRGRWPPPCASTHWPAATGHRWTGTSAVACRGMGETTGGHPRQDSFVTSVERPGCEKPPAKTPRFGHSLGSIRHQQASAYLRETPTNGRRPSKVTLAEC